MASPGSPCQQALRKRRGGTVAWEWCTNSPVMAMAATVLVKPGNAVAAHGGQGKGSMAGAFPCLVARLPSALFPAASFVLAPGNRAGCALGISARGRASIGQDGEGSTPGSR